LQVANLRGVNRRIVDFGHAACVERIPHTARGRIRCADGGLGTPRPAWLESRPARSNAFSLRLQGFSYVSPAQLIRAVTIPITRTDCCFHEQIVRPLLRETPLQHPPLEGIRQSCSDSCMAVRGALPCSGRVPILIWTFKPIIEESETEPLPEMSHFLFRVPASISALPQALTHLALIQTALTLNDAFEDKTGIRNKAARSSITFFVQTTSTKLAPLMEKQSNDT